MVSFGQTLSVLPKENTLKDILAVQLYTLLLDTLQMALKMR